MVIQVFKLVCKLRKQIYESLEFDYVFENQLKLDNFVVPTTHTRVDSYRAVVGRLDLNAGILDVLDELEIILSHLWN